MSDDLLRFVSGPTPYSAWWWVGAAALLVVVIACYAAIFVATLPSRRLRALPAIGSMHHRLLRERYARRIAATDAALRAGRLSPAEAAAEVDHAVRSFLHQATGVRAQYMQIDEFAAGDLAPVAPLLSDLADLRFNRDSGVDAGQAGTRAQELVRTWT
ncbi:MULTISPECIES: hypothetical protein [Mycobacteriaceae]|uniref:hypothetical protein n=1 Tax=Mycobacteriaceae TaxID=1762 RepID=UPI0007FDAEBC|nr:MULTISPECIES: hypothetical protein [Mycobacteriaceae]MCK0176118.1 hypothetical protein [Mycolicibacterium sp. F2034L]OBB58263.1 hypothetical protein A5757_17380 [Mycobacterium sp. 852013-51886_SCH5428379]